MLRDGDHRVGTRLTRLDEAAGEIGREEWPVQGRDPLDAETARERAGDPARRRRSRLDDVDLSLAQARARLPGRVNRPHAGCDGAGISMWLARNLSRSGTMLPPGDATIAEPPAAMTACAASSVARATPPPARVGTI
jgi:hypothetical protein